MFGPFERTVASRYLRSRRGIAGLSLGGIALGVGILIVVMSVMGGFKTDLLSRILGFNGSIGVFPQGGPLTDYAAIAARIRAVPGVRAAVPVVDGQVLMSAANVSTGGFARGIAQSDLRELRAISDHIVGGSLDAFDGPDAVAIGVGVARRFALRIGDQITLISPQGAATAFGTVPRVRAYTVATIFQVGMNEYDSNYVFMPIAAAQIFFQQPRMASQIEVTLDDLDAIDRVLPNVRAALGGIPANVVDWRQNNNSFFAAITVEQNVMFLILSLIVLIASFNVIATLTMMVKDKTRDIAVLRTIGAGRGAVLRIFLICGASVGVLGTLLGTVLGVLFCENIEAIQGWVEAVTRTSVFNPEVYYLTHLPARLNWSEVTQIILVALALSLLATVYPSWRAARTDPVRALRSE